MLRNGVYYQIENYVTPIEIVVGSYYLIVLNHLYYIKQYFLYVDYSRLPATVFKIRISG